MNKYIEQIYKNRKFNENKALQFGFKKNGDYFCFNKEILDGQFLIGLKIYNNNQIYADVIEISTGEPYTLFLVDNAVGEFVGKIRMEYEKFLKEVSKECFDDNIYKSETSKKVIKFIKDKYKDDLEFLWEKSSSAIVRRKDNKKWYAVFQIVSKRKIGIESDEIVELLGLRASADLIPDLIDNKFIFKGFHMNKKNWISICLDGSVNENSIFKMIDESYDLAKISK